ncbi:MAG: 2-hydroxyacyl-CoA dehydratase family protein, partial [Firmicutes bacterium]|nr:2-hydroxyacyl-CoA dehydratase family protein [Bacillota bacterium]
TLKGEFSFLTGVVVPQTCDNMREAFDIWREHTRFSFYHRLAVPARTDSYLGEQFYMHELENFASALKIPQGREVTPARLKEAIALHNRVRVLLDHASAARVAGRLTGTEFLVIFLAGLVTPLVRYIPVLESFLETIPAERPELNNRMRLLVTGSVVDSVEYLAAIEEAQFMVVADDLCYGSRHYAGLVSPEGDLLTALARRYLQKVSCPCKHPVGRRWEHLITTIRSCQVEGVVFILQKFCDSHWFDQPDLQKELQKTGIPVLVLEMENQAGLERLRTRVSVFREMIKHKGNT